MLSQPFSNISHVILSFPLYLPHTHTHTLFSKFLFSNPFPTFIPFPSYFASFRQSLLPHRVPKCVQVKARRVHFVKHPVHSCISKLQCNSHSISALLKITAFCSLTHASSSSSLSLPAEASVSPPWLLNTQNNWATTAWTHLFVQPYLLITRI